MRAFAHSWREPPATYWQLYDCGTSAEPRPTRPELFERSCAGVMAWLIGPQSTTLEIGASRSRRPWSESRMRMPAVSILLEDAIRLIRLAVISPV